MGPDTQSDPARALLDRLVSQTNVILTRSWEREQPTLRRKFAGYCGLAQCVAGYALQDIEADVRPVALQSIVSFYHGHAALTAHLDSRLFLIDPTFGQFCGTPVIDGAPSPENRLRQTPAGAALAKELLEHGYAELTPERARLYLAAFCNDGPYLDESEAWAFLSDPPPHPYHYHHEPDDNLFDRFVLRAKGLLIRDFAPG